MVLQAKDGGRSSLSAVANVVVTVIRNLFSPLCVDNNQIISINYTTAPGTIIGTFNATDQDPGQVSYDAYCYDGCNSNTNSDFLIALFLKSFIFSFVKLISFLSIH